MGISARTESVGESSLNTGHRGLEVRVQLIPAAGPPHQPGPAICGVRGSLDQPFGFQSLNRLSHCLLADAGPIGQVLLSGAGWWDQLQHTDAPQPQVRQFWWQSRAELGSGPRLNRLQ